MAVVSQKWGLNLLHYDDTIDNADIISLDKHLKVYDLVITEIMNLLRCVQNQWLFKNVVGSWKWGRIYIYNIYIYIHWGLEQRNSGSSSKGWCIHAVGWQHRQGSGEAGSNLQWYATRGLAGPREPPPAGSRELLLIYSLTHCSHQPAT